MEAVSLKVSWEDDLLLSEDESKESVLPLAGDLPMESPRLSLQAAENKPKLKSVVVRPKTVELDSNCDEEKSQIEGNFPCEVDVCVQKNKRFSSSASLHRHWAEVHQPLIVLYACPESKQCRWQKRPNEVEKHLQSCHKDSFSSVAAAKLACRPRSKLGQGVRKNVDYINPGSKNCPFKMRQPRVDNGAPVLPVSRKRQGDKSSTEATTPAKKTRNESSATITHQDSLQETLLDNAVASATDFKIPKNKSVLENEFQQAKDALILATSNLDQATSSLLVSHQREITRFKARELSQGTELNYLRDDIRKLKDNHSKAIHDLETERNTLKADLRKERNQRKELAATCRRLEADTLSSPTFVPPAVPTPTESAVDLTSLVGSDGKPDFSKLLNVVQNLSTVIQSQVQ